jgi:hypothetical protein
MAVFGGEFVFLFPAAGFWSFPAIPRHHTRLSPPDGTFEHKI